jgi:predicted outer membrane protein
MNIQPFTVATLATILVGSSLLAQESQPPRTQNLATRNTPVQSTGDSPTKDQIFALSMSIADQEQVLISSFAKEKATHADVKAFAAALEKSHQNAVEQLKAFSPATASVGTASDRTKRSEVKQADAKQADGTPLTETSFTQVEDNAMKVDFLKLQQEISTQCLKDSKDWLSSKKGVEFDQCFLGMQIAKHASCHSALTVLQRHSTGKLQEWIQSALVTNDKHREAAVKLMETLAESDTVPSAR